MAKAEDLFTNRKSLGEICEVPEKIISVYSLEQHVWADSNSEEARKDRVPELQTIEEFKVGPVRPFLNDILRKMAAPYKKEKKDDPIGQGYWVQAEFGSGKSHLLCFLSALALGDEQAWELVKTKEEKAGRQKRDSIYVFWREGIKSKSAADGSKGFFVVVKTLVGEGGGVVGLAGKGRRLSSFIIDAVKEQIQVELGKNISLYPAELLADRFIKEDLDKFRGQLKKFLKDPGFFEEDEYEEIDEFLDDIQQSKAPEVKKSCGDKLWRFYTEYLKAQPDIEAEIEDVFKHMVEAIMEEGYSGMLLVLDEVSQFMRDRDEEQRTDDERTLVVLSNRLAKVHNLPLWTVCSAQQAIESKMGVKNIIADDRLKLVKLLEEDKDYYDIVLSRVREIVDPSAISNYFLYYKDLFTWVQSGGEQEFTYFFPFHKPALEVLRAITYELTTARSAIHFMHQVLKHQIKLGGRELIRLWELFDETISYEEDPSGVQAGMANIKTKKESEYRAYEAARRQIEGLTKGALKVNRDKAIRVLQTLFLYHIAKLKTKGLTPEEIANSVMITRDEQSNCDENIQHYEILSDNLKKEVSQVAQAFNDEGEPLYKFLPELTGIIPQQEYEKARDKVESNEVKLEEAWKHLLALHEWPVKTRQMNFDLSHGVRSIFQNIARSFKPFDIREIAKTGDQAIETTWKGRQVSGMVRMRDFTQMASEQSHVQSIESEQNDQDFAVWISQKHAAEGSVDKILKMGYEPRNIFWTPGELNQEERERLLDFAAYRELVEFWQGKESEDAVAIINWVSNALETEMGKLEGIVTSCYARGRMDCLNNNYMDFHIAGNLESILSSVIEKVLDAAYESRDIVFDPPFTFTREEGVKVINGIVKGGAIEKGAKPDKNTSAVQNFGVGLKVVKKGAERVLDTSDNPYTKDILAFIEEKLAEEGQSMKIATIYKNFMGVGGPKNYGLTRRMVQIYLLCLVQQGKIRIDVGPKSGLPFPTIDYSNISSVEFSAKVLDSLTEVYKVKRPESWEALRPYAEKLLISSIPSTHDEAKISSYRTALLEVFKREGEAAARLEVRASSLFQTLGVPNPYENEIQQIARLFSHEITSGNDINLILYALKDALGYEAFDTNKAKQEEIDDLGNRLKNYRDLSAFMQNEVEIIAADAYCRVVLPPMKELDGVRQIQQKLASKLANLQLYIDSEVKLKTELIGHYPPIEGDSGTIYLMISEYSNIYFNMHEKVIDHISTRRDEIQTLLDSDELKALQILEDITVLQPPTSGELRDKLEEMRGSLLACPNPSKESVIERLKVNPIHDCGLSFQDYAQHMQHADAKAEEAKRHFEHSINTRFGAFLNEAIRSRLEQGAAEKSIAKLLECDSLENIRAYLVKAALEDGSFIKTINKYLKKIVVKRVEMAQFSPKAKTIERDGLEGVVDDFRNFLEDQFQEIESGDGDLPMLQFK